MPFDFASVKAMTRRVVHETLGVVATYKDATVALPFDIRARWHNKIGYHGDLLDQGYAEVVEGVDRVILFPGDPVTIDGVLSETGFVPRQNGVVTFPTPVGSFKLVLKEPKTGALEEVWQVAKI